MIGLFKKLALVICVILVVTFIIANNGNSIKLAFWPTLPPIETGLGIVLITTFISGFLIATIIGSYFSFKSYLKEKKLIKDKAKQDNALQKILEARQYTCLKEYDKALKLWNELLKIDKTCVMSYIEIAKIFIEKSNYEQALQTLKVAQKISGNNEEVIFYLAKIHKLLKNDASCLDCYTKIYSTKPCAYIAKLARDQAMDIKQYDDALEYQKSLNTISKNATLDNKENDIEFLKILKETEAESEPQISRLEKLHRYSPSHIETGLKLSEILINKNDLKQGIAVLTKLALNCKKAFIWKKIIKLWINNNEPKKAISAIGTSLKETDNNELIKSYLIAIESFMNLSMLDDARACFETFEKHIKDNNITLQYNEKLLFDFFYAMLFDNKNIKNLDWISAK